MCNSSSTEIPYPNQANYFAKVDKCIANKIIKLNKKNIKTLSSCCGHKRYKKSIIVLCKDSITRMEYFSKKIISRKRKFYKRDKLGYYYIKEIEGGENAK